MKMKSTIVWCAVVSIVFITFGSQGVFAGGSANELFSSVPYSAELYAKQEQAKQDPTIVRSRYVRVNFEHLRRKDIPEGAQSIFLNLFDDVPFIAIKDRLEVRSANRYTWFGSIEGEVHGQAILVVENGSMAGNVTIPGGFYQVRAVGHGVHAIYEINQGAFPEEAPPIHVESPDTSELDFPLSPADDGSTIDVMVVYTDDVASASSNIAAEIQLSIDETNTSYANSLINQRLRLVHSAEVPYTEAGNMGSDLDCITSKTDGCLDQIHTWRDDYGADVVSFWVESGNYCGIAYLMETVSNAFESNAFSVIKRSCATGYYSFGHELGHNMGAHHDRYVAPGPGAYDYSHGYVYLPGRWRTIMAYDQECDDAGFNCTRIQHWSNPNVTYGGVPTGVAVGLPDSADNAMTLNNTAFTVANFRESSAAVGPFFLQLNEYVDCYVLYVDLPDFTAYGSIPYYPALFGGNFSSSAGTIGVGWENGGVDYVTIFRINGTEALCQNLGTSLSCFSTATWSIASGCSATGDGPSQLSAAE